MAPQKKVVIVGSGPAGCSAAHFLGQQKIPHLLIDKALFPRPKVCGDGLAPRACLMLERIQPGFLGNLPGGTPFNRVWGGAIFAPAGHKVEIYLKKPLPGALPNALSIPRRELDAYLQSRLDPQFTTLRTGVEVAQIRRVGSGFELELRQQGGQSEKIHADILIGCDGDRSIVKKALAPRRMDPEHYVAGIRSYYTGVRGLHPDNFFELYFLDALLPGYLWVFPLPDGSANVGLGMASSDVSARKANLKQILDDALRRHPLLRERFADAVPTQKLEGWGLPLGSKMGTLSGEGFLLTGDAAALIDPLTGEGVGNALYSGWLAAEAAAKAVTEGRSDAAFFRRHYDQRVRRCISPELRFSQWMGHLFRYPRLIDRFFHRIGTRPVIQRSINLMYDAEAFRRQRYNPLFYLRLFWALFV
jgi:geranylgeranyl reductase family protein